METSTSYLPVHQKDYENEADEALLGPRETNRLPRRYDNYLSLQPVIFHLLIFALYSSVVWYRFSNIWTEQECIQRMSLWSPAMDAIEYKTVTINGNIVQRNEYVGTPRSELEEAWTRISTGPPALRLSAEELKLMNRSMTAHDYHQLPEEAGGGYLATLEVFHLLHCLNSLRKATFQEYYPEIFEDETREGRHVHLDHCVEILRQHLQCSGDVTPIAFYDVPTQLTPLPDFSTTHKCRNFDRILDWANGEAGLESGRLVPWGEVLPGVA